MFIAFTLILLVPIVGVAFLFAWRASKHAWQTNLIQTGVIVVSVLIAGLITKLISPLFYTLLSDLFSLRELAVTAPSAYKVFSGLSGLLVAPFLCVCLFLIIRSIGAIVMSLVSKSFPFEKKNKDKTMWPSIGIGVLNGLLVILIVLMPVSGMATVGRHAIDTVVVEASQSSEEASTNTDIVMKDINGIFNNPILVADYYTVGYPLFTWMTTTTIEIPQPVSLSLDSEVVYLTKAAYHGVPAIDAYENNRFTQNDKENLVDAGDALVESPVMREVTSELISASTTKWKDGKDFIGIPAPKSNAIFKDFLQALYTVLAEETSGDVATDLSTMLSMLGDIFESRVLELQDSRAVLYRMGESGLIKKIDGHLETNEHLSPLRKDLNDLSMRAMASALGTRDQNNALYYDILMNGIANSLNQSKNLPLEQRQQAVSAGIQASFAVYGMPIPADVADSASLNLIDQFSEQDASSQAVELYMAGFMVMDSAS